VVVGKRVDKKIHGNLEEIYNDSDVDPTTTENLVNFLHDNFSVMRKRQSEGEKNTPINDWQVEYVWQGIMGFTEDEKPLVGPVFGEENQYIVGGFNGDGMAKCFASGKAIADMISGILKPDEFIQSFLPKRFFEKKIGEM